VLLEARRVRLEVISVFVEVLRALLKVTRASRDH